MGAAGQHNGGVQTASSPLPGTDDRYKWVALANTTAAVFMSVLDGSRVCVIIVLRRWDRDRQADGG